MVQILWNLQFLKTNKQTNKNKPPAQLTHDPMVPFLGIPKRKESGCPHKNLYTNVDSNIICISLQMETQSPSTGQRISKSGISIQWNITWSRKRSGGTDTC